MARPSYTICGGQADADRLARQAAVMAPSVYHRPVTGSEQFWRAIVTGEAGVMLRERRRHRRIPGAPRCKTCLVPLGGPAAPMIRLVLNRRPSAKNPNYCDVCETC